MSSGELLDIQPQELQFPFELRKQISCSLQLSNKTDNYVAFEVKMTNPEMYCACPDTGVVSPRSTCDVTVTMQAQMEAPAALQCNDTLSVLQSTEDSNPEMFNREAVCQLKVVYVAPPRPPSPVREGSDEDSSSRVSVSENGDSYVDLPGSSVTAEQILDPLKGLGGVLTGIIDGAFNNGGKQTTKGVSNHTGITTGDYNGFNDFRGVLKIFLNVTTQGGEKDEHAKRIEDELNMKLKFCLSLMVFFLVILIVLVFAQVFVCAIVATQLLK